LRFTVKRNVKRRYRADVFRKAALHRTGHARRVLRLGLRKGSFTWRGSRKLRPGYYFAQVRVRSGSTSDLRRFPLLRRRGRFHHLRQYYGRATCKLLRIARLSGPSFGGRTRTSLRISFRTLRSGRATVTVKRRGKTVKRFKPRWKGAKTVLLKLRARRLPRGTYRVRIAARGGALRQKATLYSRRT
jgi:hypothetical protein